MSGDWTPELIVELVKVLSWPFSLLLLLVVIRVFWGSTFRRFFRNNTVTEVSASTKGLTAKFRESNQDLDLGSSASQYTAGLTDRTDINKIKETQNKNSTEYSDELYNGIVLHMEVLGQDKDAQIELLAKDCSLYRSALLYYEINHVIYRSQYNLLQCIYSHNGPLPLGEAKKHFDTVVELNPESYTDWDFEKYTSFLVTYQMVVVENDGLALTKLGRSYLVFMSRNPGVVSELHSI